MELEGRWERHVRWIINTVIWLDARISIEKVLVLYINFNKGILVDP